MIEGSNDRPQEYPTLKMLREEARLTQEDLSQRIGVRVRIISDWENNRKIPRADNFLALARELGVPLKTLAKAMRLDITGIPDE